MNETSDLNDLKVIENSYLITKKLYKIQHPSLTVINQWNKTNFSKVSTPWTTYKQ